MVQPIDYLGMMQRPDLGESLIGGLKTGLAIREVRDTQAAQEAAKAKQAQYAADLQQYLDNPTAGGAAAMTAKYPDQAKAIKQSWELNSQEQKDSLFNDGTRAYSAIQSGRPEIAEQIISDRITALENSGQDASAFKSIRDSLKSNPQSALASIGMTLANAEPDKWGKIAGEMRAAEQAPFELSEKQSKAAKSAVDAKFAESKAVQDLQKGGWEIQKLANDIEISRLNSQIAAMNANINRETNDLKRQEQQFKLQEKQDKRDAALNTKVAEVESGRATIDNFLNTADKILKTPGNVVESATGTVSTVLPTFFESTADFEETLKTLGSQAFLSQVPAMKGLGALTEAEGRKLESSLANLSTRQSPQKLLENVQEAQRLMLKARSNLSTKYGVPDVIPDRPAQETQPASSGFRVLGVE